MLPPFFYSSRVCMVCILHRRAHFAVIRFILEARNRPVSIPRAFFLSPETMETRPRLPVRSLSSLK